MTAPDHYILHYVPFGHTHTHRRVLRPVPADSCAVRAFSCLYTECMYTAPAPKSFYAMGRQDLRHGERPKAARTGRECLRVKENVLKKRDRASGGRHPSVRRKKILLTGCLVILLIFMPVQAAMGSSVPRKTAAAWSGPVLSAADVSQSAPAGQKGETRKASGQEGSEGSDQEASDQKESNQKESNQKDSNQMDSENKSSDQEASGQEENGKKDPGQTGTGREDPGQDDPGQSDPAQTDPAPEEPGQGTSGLEKEGEGGGKADTGDTAEKETAAADGATGEEEPEKEQPPEDRGGEPETTADPAEEKGKRDETAGRAAGDETAASREGSGRTEQADTARDTAADPGQKEEKSGEPAAGRSGAAPAEAAAEAEENAFPAEEPWMTVSEFNRAFESVTSGAANAGASTLSNAKIVSKESEINYEDLGIGTHVSGHPGHTTPINVRDGDGNDYTGVCVVPDDRGWPKGTVLPNVTRVTDASMIKLYYYTMLDSYGEDLAKSKGFGSDSKKVAVAACHEAMSMRYAQLAGIEYDRPNVKSNLSSLISAYRTGVSSKPTPDADKVFVYISARTQSGGHWMQAYVFGRVEEDEPSSIVLKKVSSDPDMRNAYSLYYCLHETASGGTVNFRMYTDKACTKRAIVYTDANMTKELDPIPVGMSGKSGLWNQAVFYCAPGTYYLKELNTPRGYQPHSDPFGPYTLQEGKGKTIKVENSPVYAKAGVLKKDAKTGKGLPDAKFGLYADLEDARNEAEPMGVFTTGGDGRSNQLEVLAGRTYYVREIQAPPGYKLISGVRALNVAEGFSEVAWTEFTNEPDTGTVQVRKISADPAVDLQAAGSPYSLEGAEYTLYDAKGEVAGTMTTDAAGVSNVLTVLCGSYTVKETKPSPGFDPDPNTYTVTAEPDGEVVVESVEPVQKTRITLHKSSSEEKEEKARDTLPIAGAVYGIYASEDDAGEEQAALGTFLVKEDGSANTVEVLAGRTYYVKETKTPEGYLPDGTIHKVEAKSLKETVTVESEDRLIFGGVKVCKLDLETSAGTPLGTASLEGAVLKIYNDDERSVYADGKKILPGAEAMTLTTDAGGIAQTGSGALSYGRYRIEEVTAPEGYTKKGAKPVRFSIREDGRVVDLTGSAETSVQDQVIRGDFSIRKINSYTQKRMAGVTFEVTALDREGKELEKHRFTTDKNGCFESTAAFAAGQAGPGAAGTAQAGNAAEQTDTAAPPETEGPAEADGQAETAAGGRLWFGAGTEPADSLGALPFGDYHIEEIEGENNRGMKMFADDFSIYADGQVLELGNIENTRRPVLETELLDEDGDHFADQKGIVTLTDTVTYAGMEDYIGKEVTFHGVIHVRETGQPLVIDGRTVECVKTKKILSHTSTVQLRFTFDASKAQGMALVCYEYASEAVRSDPDGDGGTGDASAPVSGPAPAYRDSTNGGTDIASHTDPEDEAQSIHLVSIETDARDQLTGMHVGEARDGAVTVDHVTCRGLTPGQKYLVTGILVDKSNGRPLQTEEGKQITAKASFTAGSATEIVDLTFTYDASLLEGTTVVAFEYLYLDGPDLPQTPGEDEPGEGGTPGEDGPESGEQGDQTPGGGDPDPGIPDRNPPIAVHEDPDDEDQSIHYPLIRTHATGADDVSRTLTADGTLIVHDRVTWENLLPGRTYRLQGILMLKDTGEAFQPDGEAVTASASFTAETRKGETTLAFSFDADPVRSSMEQGTLSIVAFEDLYAEAYLIASHKDLTDPDQTVYLCREEKQKEKESDIPGNPDTPEKPDQPSEQGKTSEPEKPDTSDQTKETEKRKKTTTPSSPDTIREAKSAKTGDSTDIVLYLVPALLAAAGLAVVVIMKFQKKR